MTKALLALGAAAVALSAVPADAQNRHHGRTCANWRHSTCVRWMNNGYSQSMSARQRNAARRAAYRTGYRFGPSYDYTAYDQLPRTYVTRYHLRPNYRYVYRDNVVYVVNPRTYAVERVINALTR